MKIWAKVLKDNKIVKQTVYEAEGKMVWSGLHEHLTNIAYALDIPTPILIKTHIFNFAKFNHVRFRASDFVEKIEFDQLFLEMLSDK